MGVLMIFQPVTPDEKLSHAVAQAKIRGPEIAALLHSAFHDGAYLPEGRVAERIHEARVCAERLLLAIAQAEEALASEAPVASANAVLEPFPGNGVVS